MKGEITMKKEITKPTYLTIAQTQLYTNYVATLKLKKGDKHVYKDIVFMRTPTELKVLTAYGEQHCVYSNRKITISPNNDTIRLATREDLHKLAKRIY